MAPLSCSNHAVKSTQVSASEITGYAPAVWPVLWLLYGLAFLSVCVVGNTAESAVEEFYSDKKRI